VVEDTWLAVLRGLPKFERRSRLKTWIFHILANRPRATARAIPDRPESARASRPQAAWLSRQPRDVTAARQAHARTASAPTA
jgi:DNA-directed RNA polymerase specialized sigma24 family protein